MSFERDERFYSSVLDLGGRIRDWMPLFARRGDDCRPSAYEEYVPYAQFQRERLSPTPPVGPAMSHSKSAVDVRRKPSTLDPADIARMHHQPRRSSAQPPPTHVQSARESRASTACHSVSTSGGNLSIPPSSRRSSVERVIDRQRALANMPQSHSRSRLSPSPRSSRPPSADLQHSATVSTRSCSPASRDDGRSPAPSITCSLDMDDSISMRTSATDLSFQRSASEASFSPIHIPVLSLPPDTCGEILLSLHYNTQASALDVTIHKARGLPHFAGHKPNPYVKISLLSENGHSEVAKLKTACKKGTSEPAFSETKRFPSMTRSEVEHHVLRVSVWHRDFFSHKGLLGETRMALLHFPWHDASNPNGQWVSLRGVTDENEPLEKRTIVAKVSLAFKIEDRERKIGTLEVILNNLHFDPAPGKRAQHHLEGKIYFGEKRVTKRQVRIPSETAKGLPIGHAIRFSEQNLNDLHVRSLKLQLWETSGLGARSLVGKAELNPIDHRRGLSVTESCSCELCTGWHRMISHSTHVANVDVPMSGKGGKGSG